LLVGPVFSREFTIAPRRPRLYIGRAAYVLALLGLMSIAWMMLTGTQLVRDLGDLARFGTLLFEILAPLQLVVAVFFSALSAASAVAQEKDRRTLVLLLLTNLSNSELVLGKLLASLLNVFVLMAAAVPLFMLSVLFGGVSFGQVALVFAVTVAGILVCGSLGSTLALWREKTFQALAMTVLVLVLWVAVWRIVAVGVLGEAWLGLGCRSWAVAFSPWEAIQEAVRPFPPSDLGPLGTPVHLFLAVAVLMSIVINGIAIAMVRVWNPSREALPTDEDRANSCRRRLPSPTEAADRRQESPPTADPVKQPARTRRVWDNPILWREVRTWAYGRKILMIRLVYLVLFALAVAAAHGMLREGPALTSAQGAAALVPLALLSLFLLNAQAVTSMTSERDARALDLLLVSDLTPKEIVFGKLGGVYYNTKEMVVGPMLLCVYLWWMGAVGMENLVYLVAALAVLGFFAVVLGIHAGMHYFNSRAAVATSLGTLFFLFVGVAVCMRMMVAFSGSFQAQLQPFLAFTLGGGVGLYVALGGRNPSTAIGVASFLCPLATFYAITSFLLNQMLAVFLVTVAAYGFATAAMLVPAIHEFDVATGRTTIED
jgi:ABC-type transport system involved in multi-copper enzyme maturation permease subunit